MFPVLFLAIMLASGPYANPMKANHTGWHCEHIGLTDAVNRSLLIYRDYTKYNHEMYFGVDEWNWVSGGNYVRLLADTANTPPSLHFVDYRSNDGNFGVYQPRSGADELRFNVTFMDPASHVDRDGTSSHELGHALHLGDHCGRDYDHLLMYEAVNGVRYTKGHDRSDYYYWWY